MTKLLVALFIRDRDNVRSPAVRARYGALSSGVGVVCNLALFVLKLVLGALSGSIAVTADAFNNLSDAGSAVMTFLGFRIASKPADKEHPYGHGRMEYLGGLAVAVLILLVGLEFAKSSIEKIIHPEPISFSWVVVIGLAASILVKLWLSVFNRKLGKKLQSAAMEASAADSISDVLATGVTLVAVITARFTTLPIDGVMGLVVSLLVLFAGVQVARDTASPLLGRAPDPKLIAQIRHLVLSFDGVLGVHDIIVHDYGPGRIFASLHAEVPMTADVMRSHALIDHIESELAKELGIEVVIHMDPLDTECALTGELKTLAESAAQRLSPDFSIHDFRVIESGSNINLIFDLAVPVDEKRTNSALIAQLSEEIRAQGAQYYPKITVDRAF